MKKHSARRVWAALAALLLLFLCQADGLSQRRRPSRRATNPARTQQPAPSPTPSASEPALISTADEQQDETPRRNTTARTRRNAAQEAEQQQDQMRGTIDRLSTQVERLTDDITRMKTDQRALFDLERLTRAEQRAETLRAQLRDVTDKEFQYQERLDQIQYELEPDSIQRRAALIGTLNPGAVRDTIQRGLERERDRVQKQLEMLANSRSRLEAAVASAEQEVERLRQRVDAADQEQANTGASPEPTTAQPTAAPSPTPTPAEPPKE